MHRILPASLDDARQILERHRVVPLVRPDEAVEICCDGHAVQLQFGTKRARRKSSICECAEGLTERRAKIHARTHASRGALVPNAAIRSRSNAAISDVVGTSMSARSATVILLNLKCSHQLPKGEISRWAVEKQEMVQLASDGDAKLLEFQLEILIRVHAVVPSNVGFSNLGGSVRQGSFGPKIVLGIQKRVVIWGESRTTQPRPICTATSADVLRREDGVLQRGLLGAWHVRLQGAKQILVMHISIVRYGAVLQDIVDLLLPKVQIKLQENRVESRLQHEAAPVSVNLPQLLHHHVGSVKRVCLQPSSVDSILRSAHPCKQNTTER